MPTPAVSIVNVGYRSTNYWVISAGRSRALVDLGWLGTIGTMRANLGRADIPLREIRYALATHYHIDHAGVAQSVLLDDGPVFTGDLTARA
jgi:glyoxylase-like metal-dependent hydrolase (beta-lactamase superfamily II)